MLPWFCLNMLWMLARLTSTWYVPLVGGEMCREVEERLHERGGKKSQEHKS